MKKEQVVYSSIRGTGDRIKWGSKAFEVPQRPLTTPGHVISAFVAVDSVCVCVCVCV